MDKDKLAKINKRYEKKRVQKHGAGAAGLCQQRGFFAVG